MNWPNDEDGDVFRLLQQNGFDFERISKVDFEIDFDHWPLTTNEKELIKKLYSDCEFYEPDEEDIEEGNTTGYAQCRFEAKLTYEYVVKTQKSITDEMKRIGGWCNSWGVLF